MPSLRLWPTPFIELADDNTFVDKAWSRQGVSALGTAGVPWFTETDVSVADDPALLDLLADSRCRQLSIGFEAPSATKLTDLDASDFKRKRTDSYLRAIDAIQSRCISVNGCFIVGLDTQAAGAFRLTELSRWTSVDEAMRTALPFLLLIACASTRPVASRCVSKRSKARCGGRRLAACALSSASLSQPRPSAGASPPR